MRRIDILGIKLEKFRGTTSLVVESPNGEDILVSGPNGTGKTTIADAISWILFDKDSLGNGQFDIKPYGKGGLHDPNIKSEVELTLSVDGVGLTLKRTYGETWSTTRGTSEKKLANTSAYEVDGVPANESEFRKRISEIADANTLRILTDPTFFGSKMPWKDRRDMLVGLFGDVSDAQVIASDDKFSGIPGILDGKSVDDRLAIIAKDKPLAVEKQKSLGVQAAERLTMLDEVRGLELKDGAVLKKQIDELNAQKALVGSSAELPQAEAELARAKTALAEFDRQAIQNQSDELPKLQKALSDAMSAETRIKADIESIENKIKINEDLKPGLETTLNGLRTEYSEISAREFVWSGSEVCETCAQALPADRIDQLKSEALGNFNEKKSNELEANKAAGVESKTKLEKLGANIQALIAERAAKTAELADAVRARELAQTNLDSASAVGAPAADTGRDALELAVKTCQERIDSIAAGTGTKSKELNESLARLEAEIGEIHAHNARVRSVADHQAKLAEYEAEQAKLKSIIEDYERAKFLLEQFVAAKANMLTEKINGFFPTIRWNLFEIQVNGGIKAICEPSQEGKPLSALSTAESINAGLEIIDVLGKAIGLTIPITLDGGESCLKPIPTTAQKVILSVANQKELSIKLQPKSTKEVA